MSRMRCWSALPNGDAVRVPRDCKQGEVMMGSQIVMRNVIGLPLVAGLASMGLLPLMGAGWVGTLVFTGNLGLWLYWTARQMRKANVRA